MKYAKIVKLKMMKIIGLIFARHINQLICTIKQKKADFNDIYSHEIEVLRPIVDQIEKVWNTRTGSGTMNR